MMSCFLLGLGVSTTFLVLRASICEIRKWDTMYATVEHSTSSTYECWKLSTNTCMCLFVFGVYMLHKSCLVSLIRFKSKYCFCCVLPNAVETIGRMIRLVWHPSMNPFCFFFSVIQNSCGCWIPFQEKWTLKTEIGKLRRFCTHCGVYLHQFHHESKTSFSLRWVIWFLHLHWCCSV